MKATMKIILCVAVISLNEANGLNCDDLPKGHPGECCRTSQKFKEVDKIAKIVDEHKGKKFGDYMMECKINEDVFKELKLTKADDVDMIEIDKYIDAAFEDKVSAENYKKAALKCYNEITSNFANIQSKYEASPFELKKDECNIKFMAMMTCVEFQTFLNCPKDYSLVSKECDEVHEWMENCTKDTYSFAEIIKRSQPK